jgi:biopolymer transport protein ExbD
MAIRGHSAESEDHGIDLAPMLDFVLNLLIFFIITTSFIKEAGVQVEKEFAETAEQRESGNILIAVRKNAEVWMDRKRIDVRDIRPTIEKLHIERPDDTVVVIPDKEAPVGVLAQVMDEVRRGGIKDVAIAAQPVEG